MLFSFLARTMGWAGLFQPELVALAVLVCAIGSYATVVLLARASAARTGARTRWMAGATIAFGADVWSTHFIAMLAFRPEMAISYRLVPTALSILIATLGAVPPFALLTARRGRRWVVPVAGAALGLTIAAMHFTGMAAMEGPTALLYAAPVVALAILLAVGFATLAARAMARRHGLRDTLVATGTLLMAIVALHFVAMAGLTIVMPVVCGLPAHGLPAFPLPPPAGLGRTNLWLAGAVATISGFILFAGIGGTIADRRLALAREVEQRRLRALADSASGGMAIVEDGAIHMANEALCTMLGRARAEIVGHALLECIAPDHHAAILGAISRGRDGGTRAEAVLLARGGARIAVELSIHPGEWEGRPAAMLGFRDLSAIHAAEQRLNYLAHHDGLTGLFNRATLEERLAWEIAHLGERGNFALLYLDLDGFKPVNDLHGHRAGDAVLALVAERLRAATRAGDTVARIGGDEFVILQGGHAETAQPAAAAALAQRLLEALAAPFAVGEQSVRVGASIGIAVAPADGSTAETLLRSADTALYQAKGGGRGGYCFFEPEMDRRLKARRVLERDLRLAVGSAQISVQYQPIFDGAERRLAGFEALMRWNHPERGAVAPAEFIPLAEETGLILPLGLHVLETACREAAGWPGDCPVAVNLSPVQFRDPDLTRTVAAILERTGLPPHRLELEVTEGFLIERPEQARTTLLGLRALGVGIALDDFGTGYSSLSYLSRFPFDRIKIDRSFVRGLEQDRDAAAIVRAIVGLGHSLRMAVTAEGVETDQQLVLLGREGCDRIQGFLLGRPMPPEQARALLGAAPAATSEAERLAVP